MIRLQQLDAHLYVFVPSCDCFGDGAVADHARVYVFPNTWPVMGTSQPAEPRSRYPPEERAVELARTLSSRRYLDGGSEMEDVAALLVEAAASFSMHTSVR